MLKLLDTFLDHILRPILETMFQPFDLVLSMLYMPWARITALAFFIGTMIWVFTLNRAYVTPNTHQKQIWKDLRFWTILSMLPHVIVYFYF